MMMAQDENVVLKFGYWIKIYIYIFRKQYINIGSPLIPVGFISVS